MAKTYIISGKQLQKGPIGNWYKYEWVFFSFGSSLHCLISMGKIEISIGVGGALEIRRRNALPKYRKLYGHCMAKKGLVLFNLSLILLKIVIKWGKVSQITTNIEYWCIFSNH